MSADTNTETAPLAPWTIERLARLEGSVTGWVEFFTKNPRRADEFGYRAHQDQDALNNLRKANGVTARDYRVTAALLAAARTTAYTAA